MSKIQVNEIVNHFDNGAPDCPRGLTVTGVSTFSGVRVSSGSSIGIGTDNPISSIQVVDGDIRISNRSGITTGSYRRTISNNYQWTGSAENSDIPVGTYGISIDNTDQTTNSTVALAKFVTFQNSSSLNPGIVYIGAVDSGESTNHSADFIVALKDGSPTVVERLRISHDGQVVLPDGSPGIQFGTFSSPVTSTSLDDYEEGTWTPELADAATGGNVATATVNGRYVKIGSQVTVSLDLANINTTGLTGGNAIFIRNLPYTIPNRNGTIRYTGPTAYSNMTLSNNYNNMMLVVQDSQAYMRLLKTSTSSADAASSVLISQIASGTADIRGSVVYSIS